MLAYRLSALAGMHHRPERSRATRGQEPQRVLGLVLGTVGKGLLEKAWA